MRHHADRVQAQRLTLADVEVLRSDPSPENRARVAAKFGGQFDELAGGPQRELALAVLELLVRDAAAEVRQTLAQAVAASPQLPLAAAGRLAADVPEVARPVLQRSPVLRDEDLLGALRAGGKRHALAITGRGQISEALGEALAEAGDLEVVGRLLDNAGAALSERAAARMLDDHGDDPQVEARLIRRTGLPPALVERLVDRVALRLGWDLVRDRQVTPDRARAIIHPMLERAASDPTTREHADRNLAQSLAERHRVGELGHEELLRRLRDGDVAGVELGLALHARLDPGVVRRLLGHGDRRHLAALGVSAGLPTPYYVVLRMVIDLSEAALAGQIPGYNVETIRYVQVEYERLRRDSVRLRELVGV